MFGKESKADVEQSSDVSDASPPVKATFFQRFRAHMKKWWWAYLLGFIVIVLVTVLPIIYVGVPRFASDYINDYQYDYDGLEITNPTPNSLHVKQSKSLSMGGGFSGSGYLTAFNAYVHNEGSDTAFAVFPVPRIEFDGGADLNIDQELEIACVSCLSEIAAAAASDKKLEMRVTGNPDLKFGALPTAHLNINKKMTMDGYNVQEFINSDGAFNVTSLDFKQEPDESGYNVNATVAVRNPTPFMVEIVKGTTSFNLTVGDTPIGYVDLPHLQLKHNAENVTETQVLGNIDTKILIQEGLWGDNDDGFATVSIGIHGNEVYYNGKEIPYFTAAMKAINATVKVDLLDYASEVL